MALVWNNMQNIKIIAKAIWIICTANIPALAIGIIIGIAGQQHFISKPTYEMLKLEAFPEKDFSYCTNLITNIANLTFEDKGCSVNAVNRMRCINKCYNPMTGLFENHCVEKVITRIHKINACNDGTRKEKDVHNVEC